MALSFLQHLLQDELDKRGRADLMTSAVDRIAFTDDGSTIYVHLFPKLGSARAQGRAYVLAWHDYAADPQQRLDCFRWLLTEAKLSLVENIDTICRWLEGR